MTAMAVYCVLLCVVMTASFVTAFMPNMPDRVRAWLLIAGLWSCAALISALSAHLVLVNRIGAETVQETGSVAATLLLGLAETLLALAVARKF